MASSRGKLPCSVTIATVSHIASTDELVHVLVMDTKS